MSDEQNQSKKMSTCTLMRILTILSLIFSIIALTISILAYTGNGNMPTPKKIVISKQFDKGKSLEKAKEENKPIIVFFYTDWCGFCQKFAPTFNKITKNKKIKENFAVAYVNCENPENKELMQEYEIKGFPSVFVIKEDKKTQIENIILFGEDNEKAIKEKVFEIIENN